MDSEDVYRLKKILFSGSNDWEKEYQLICRKYNVNILKDGILLTWIMEDELKSGKDRSDSYYRNLKNMIDASFTTLYEYWTKEVVKNWISIFVQQKYPWILCNSWSHLSGEYFEFLLEQSLLHFHVSNLFQITKNYPMITFWNSNFWKNQFNVNNFFYRRGRFMKREFVSLIKHLASDMDKIDNNNINIIKQSLVKTNSPLFKVFVEHFYQTNTCSSSIIYWLNTIISESNVNLLKWWVSKFKMNINYEEWYHLFVTVHPYHITHKLDKNYRSREKTEILHILLNAFKENNINNPKIWQDLSIYIEADHSLFDIFAISYEGYSLLSFYFDELKHSVCRTLQEDAHLDEPNNFFKTIPIEQLFQSIEKKNTSSEGWTPLTNAIRWGNGSTVLWLINQGSSIHTMSYTNNLRMAHNLLSLSMYNSDESVLQQILNHPSCKPFLQQWLNNCIVDIVVGITRPWIPTCFALKKLQILHNILGLSNHKESLLSSLCRYVKLQNTGDLCNNMLIQYIGNLPGKLSSEYAYDIVYNNKNYDMHLNMLNTLIENGMINLTKLYSLLLKSDVPTSWVMLLEYYYAFNIEIRNIPLKFKMDILQSWIYRHGDTPNIRYILNKMINGWGWNLNQFSRKYYNYINYSYTPQQLLKWFYEAMIYQFPYILDCSSIYVSNYPYQTEFANEIMKLTRGFSVMTRFLKRKEKELHKDVHTKRKRMIYQMVTYPGVFPICPYRGHVLKEGSMVYQRMLKCFR